MPYRRLPKTDVARLKALQTVIGNDDLYTVKKRVIDWKVMNQCQPAYDKLYTAIEQCRIMRAALRRAAIKQEKMQKKAAMYVGHFLQVFSMAMERGEIKEKYREQYGLETEGGFHGLLRDRETFVALGRQVIEAEKDRIKKGGFPIYNPSIGKVATHFDVFVAAMQECQAREEQVDMAVRKVQEQRVEADGVIEELWNQIEAFYAQEPPEVRFDKCRQLGIIYYYRRHEEHLY